MGDQEDHVESNRMLLPYPSANEWIFLSQPVQYAHWNEESIKDESHDHRVHYCVEQHCNPRRNQIWTVKRPGHKQGKEKKHAPQQRTGQYPNRGTRGAVAPIRRQRAPRSTPGRTSGLRKSSLEALRLKSSCINVDGTACDRFKG